MQDLVPVMAGDRANTEITARSGRTYRARDGRFMMTPADARDARAGAEAFTPNLGPGLGAPGGFICQQCGRHNYFKTCGGCGHAG